jgi:hypothetical protein
MSPLLLPLLKAVRAPEGLSSGRELGWLPSKEVGLSQQPLPNCTDI